ncbi:MAG: FMN-binding protein [Pseudomonadota bacterium]
MLADHLKGRLARPLLLILLLTGLSTVYARGVYQEPEEFVTEAFAGKVPKTQRIWLSGELGNTYRQVMQEAPPQLRLRYWKRETRSVWILQAIGKEHPITAGFIVERGRLQLAKVLTFRENRGWEIRYPFFTNQFQQVGLGEQGQLDTHIDAITGATLSVRAMNHMARMALLLAKQVGDTHVTP